MWVMLSFGFSFDSASELEIEDRVALLTEEDGWDRDHRVCDRRVCFI